MPAMAAAAARRSPLRGHVLAHSAPTPDAGQKTASVAPSGTVIRPRTIAAAYAQPKAKNLPYMRLPCRLDRGPIPATPPRGHLPIGRTGRGLREPEGAAYESFGRENAGGRPGSWGGLLGDLAR